jgi:hypothetical protein
MRLLEMACTLTGIMRMNVDDRCGTPSWPFGPGMLCRKEILPAFSCLDGAGLHTTVFSG